MEDDTCQSLLRSLSEYVDGEIDPQVCAAIDRHLAGCEKCRIVVDSLRKTVALYHSQAGEVDLPQAVRERLFHCLDLDEFMNQG